MGANVIRVGPGFHKPDGCRDQKCANGAPSCQPPRSVSGRSPNPSASTLRPQSHIYPIAVAPAKRDQEMAPKLEGLMLSVIVSKVDIDTG